MHELGACVQVFVRRICVSGLPVGLLFSPFFPPLVSGPTMAHHPVMYGRMMCNTNCGRWAVFDTDRAEPRQINMGSWCPLCYNVNEAGDVNVRWRTRMTRLASQSSLQALLNVPDVTEIVRSFVTFRPDKYTDCCRCGDWVAFPCVNSWFDVGWVCPEYWRDHHRHQ